MQLQNQSEMYNLLQDHTVQIYSLKEQNFVIEDVEAATLLSSSRFDLYAKLYYIRHRESKPTLAAKVYGEHILAFNPDGKEPGRSDKNGSADFLGVFNDLIDCFKYNDFDPSVSLVPVDKNYVPLDGSHRVAALAYFHRKLKIVRFPDIEAKAVFDFRYFLKRGLRRETADLIANEIPLYIKSLHVACLWPRMRTKDGKAFALNHFQRSYEVFYEKSMKVSLEGMSSLIYHAYRHQDWVGTAGNNFKGAKSKALNCYAPHGTIDFVLFKAADLESVVRSKEIIRRFYRLDKHALHITDDDAETADILELILTERSKDLQNGQARFSDYLSEKVELLKNVYWLRFKVAVAKLIGKK